MLNVRHGIMVVGPTGGGKSSNIRMLGNALTKLKQKEVEGDKFEIVKIHHLNPKSVRMGELYGEFDSNTVRYQQSTASDICDKYYVFLILFNLFYLSSFTSDSHVTQFLYYRCHHHYLFSPVLLQFVCEANWIL